MRPVLSITPRKVVEPFAAGEWTLPPGVHVTPCLTWPTAAPSRGRTRPRSGPSASSTARPPRTPGSRSAAASAAAPAPPSRRWSCTRCCARSCVASTLPPDRPAGERMRRRGVTLTPVARRPGRPASVGRAQMTSLFCRHNRMTAKCPICSKEMEAELRAKAPPRPPGIRRAPAAPPARSARRAARAGGLVTRRLARASDDGYRNALVPGLRATADAERLAAALAIAAERLEPPGPYDAVATEPDREQATWLAFLLALAGPDDPERQDAVAAAPTRFEDGELPEPVARARPRSRGVPPMGRTRRLAGGRLHGRARLVAAAPLRARVRAARAARAWSRAALRAARHARRGRPLRARARHAAAQRGGRPGPPRAPSARCCRATRCCSSAGRATSRPRARVPLAALDRGFALWDDPGATSSRWTSPARRCARPRARAPGPPGGAQPRGANGDERRPSCAGAAQRAGTARSRGGGCSCSAASSLAALAHYLPAGPTYDPWAWIIWGREITEWDLDTRTGPSWKPLPVLFTTPFALAGDEAAPELWLVIAQAGGLLAFAFTYRLAARLAGWPAGIVAAGGLFLADEFIRNFARGNSEGLLVGLCLWAVERHLDGRRRDAFLFGVAAGLLRPELWPFLLALRPLADVDAMPRTRAARGRLRRAHGGRLAGARVPRLGRLHARRRARPRAQPGLGRVRRLPVRRDVPALGGGADGAAPARGGDRAGARMAACATACGCCWAGSRLR